MTSCYTSTTPWHDLLRQSAKTKYCTRGGHCCAEKGADVENPGGFCSPGSAFRIARPHSYPIQSNHRNQSRRSFGESSLKDNWETKGRLLALFCSKGKCSPGVHKRRYYGKIVCCLNSNFERWKHKYECVALNGFVTGQALQGLCVRRSESLPLKWGGYVSKTWCFVGPWNPQAPVFWILFKYSVDVAFNLNSMYIFFVHCRGERI